MRNSRSASSPISVADYLAPEEKSLHRHEYLGGEIFTMNGASTRHNLISSNILRALDGPARRHGCRVYIEGVKVRVAADVIYYSDVMVACGRVADDELVVENPSFVVEVASPSTRGTDRREKLTNYRKVESLHGYLIVEQKRRHVILYSRVRGDEWERLELFGSGEVPIPFLEYMLTLDEIYEDVPTPPLSVGERDDEEAYVFDDEES